MCVEFTGAIGNLIRNGAELSGAMAEHRVVEMLLYILMNDDDPAPKVRSLDIVVEVGV